VFSSKLSDPNECKSYPAELKAGSVDINGMNRFKPFNPFGGYKDSGMGREHGIYSLRERCQVKAVSDIK